MNEVLDYIANLGFPIVLSIFLLVRIETKLSELSGCITELSRAILSSSK